MPISVATHPYLVSVGVGLSPVVQWAQSSDLPAVTSTCVDQEQVLLTPLTGQRHSGQHD